MARTLWFEDVDGPEEWAVQQSAMRLDSYLRSWRSADEVLCFTTLRGWCPTVEDHPNVVTVQTSCAL